MKKNGELEHSVYIYANEEKADALLSEIYTFVISQFELQTKKGKGFSGKVKVGLNKFLSKCGLPDIETEFGGNFERENIKSVVSSVTFDSKVKMLKSYYKMNGRYPCFNLQSGEYYEYKNNKKIIKEKLFNDKLVGVVHGKFVAKRIYPPVEPLVSLAEDVHSFTSNELGLIKISKKQNVFDEYSDKRNNLWNLYTINSHAIQGEIPFIIGNIRTVSQYALIKLYKFSEYEIDAIGILEWHDNVLICDPIAFSLY